MAQFPRCTTRHLPDRILQVYVLYLSLSSLVHATSARPITFNFGEWVEGQLFPTKGATLEEEIHCYNLPYGGIGTISHFLTYYTVTVIGIGRSPLWPKNKLQHEWWDLIINCVSFLAAAPLAALSISACRNRWEFVCIGIWKLTLTFAVNAVGAHQSILLWRHGKPSKTGKLFRWLLLYMAGALVGLAGLLSLVYSSWHEGVINHDIHIITAAFAATAVLIASLKILVHFWGDSRIPGKDAAAEFGRKNLGKTSFCFAFGFAVALFSDWILAAIAQNFVGTPSENNLVTYWAYFVAKRLPMLAG
jgi:hypothetical protein